MAACPVCGGILDAVENCVNRYCGAAWIEADNAALNEAEDIRVENIDDITDLLVEQGGVILNETQTDESVRVRQWRFEQFVQLGFVEDDASKLAASEADLHEAAHLVKDQGCPIKQAVEILA